MEKKQCFACRAVITSKNHIGLNKKLLGRNAARFYCIDCMAEHYEITTEELLDRIEDFKSQGCGLFE